MMVQQEKRLLWHPRRENRFVVGGGSQITLYEWVPEHPKIRHVTSQQDLHYMKCFAWSPDAALDDLIAVGVNTGKVDLIRLEAAKHTRGEKLSSGPTVSLAVRNSRTCNAVAFCNTDPNYLAVGLDKVRGDCSLVIWDISSAVPLLSLDPNPPQDSSPSLASVARPQPTIPRFDTNPRNDPRILQQYAPQEMVSCLSFLPNSTHLLLAGISYRWLRLFDLRTPASNILNVPGRIQAIAIDPFNQHQAASIGDNTVSIWDTRKLVSPLMFSERNAIADGARLRPGAVFNTVEFSSTRRGCLATLEKDSSYVRFWDLMDAPSASNEHLGLWAADSTRTSKDFGRAPARRSWAATLPWQTGGHQFPGGIGERTSSMDYNSSLVLANTRRTKAFSKPLSSFALAPNLKSPHPLTTNVMVVNRDGDLELYAIYDAPKQSVWSARGDLTFGSGVNLKTITGSLDDDLALEAPFTAQSYRFGIASEHGRASHSRSTHARDDSLVRGRAGVESSPASAPPPIASPALFGRGDEEGFPALGSSMKPSAPTGLTATRPQKGRTYSPAALRKYQNNEQSDQHHSQSSVRHRSVSGEEHMPMSGEHGLMGERFESGRVRRRQQLRAGRNKDLISTVEDDISMLMRRRTILGYGLGSPQQNIWITREEYDPLDAHSQTLSDLWAWISHSHVLLCVPTARVHGYDFTHQGILGIWEGLPPLDSQMDEETSVTVEQPLSDFGGTAHERKASKGNFSLNDDFPGGFPAALRALEGRKTGETSTWKPAVNTAKLVQRQIAMKLCGWCLKEDELNTAVSRWEKEGQHTRAAAWLVFTRQFSKALEVLLRSNEMSHKMMSGTIAALIPHGTSSTPLRHHDLREHCERLINDMKDPYFCAMLTYLAVGDWADVLKEESIPLRERLAIALQFLEDKPLSTYLRHVIERSIAKGNVNALLITGLTKPGISILQTYVDNTGDIQTAAILGSYVCHRIRDSRMVRWLESYRDMLDGFKLHHSRVLFDIERGQILTEAMQNGDIPPVEVIPRQVLIRCNYCGKPVVPEEQLSLTEQAKWKPTTCSNCQRSLPRCSVCLLTLSIVPDAAREIDLADSPHKDTIDDAIVICQTCRHGGHASHLMEWFFGEGERSRGMCPVADCDCRCADGF